MTVRAALILALAAVQALASATSQATERPPPPVDEHAIHSVSSSAILGGEHLARLRRHVQRALRGETVTIGAIGGSITAGTGASQPASSYVERVVSWWRTHVDPSVQVVNAGVGATGSNYGALRARRDLLEKSPDIVLVEFAVNDPDDARSTEWLEGLCRQILSQPNQPAVILVFMVARAGWSAEPHQRAVGVHYGLPMVSLREAGALYAAAAGISRDALFVDVVHPSDEGHGLAAALVTRVLERAVRVAAERPSTNRPAKLRRPLISDRYQRVALLEAANLRPERNVGWTFDPARFAWVADKPGSVIEFRIAGRAPVLMDWAMRGPMGVAAVSVDGGDAATRRDAYVEDAGSGWRVTTELTAPADRRSHLVRVEITPEHAAASSGHEFRILGVGAADA